MTQTNFNLSLNALENLLVTASATEAILMFGGDHADCVRAGNLGDIGFEDLSSALQRYWPAAIQRDLNRYVGISLDNKFNILFAKYLPEGEHLLGLVFPPQTPLIRIRQDMTDMMRAVLAYADLEKDPTQPLERSLQLILKPYPEPDPEGINKSNPMDQSVKNDPGNQKIEDTFVPEIVVHPLKPVGENTAQPKEGFLPLSELGESAQQKTALWGSEVDFDRNTADVSWQPIDVSWPLPDENHQDTTGSSVGEKSSSKDEAHIDLIKSHTWQPLDELGHEENDLISILQDDFELRDTPTGLNEWVLEKNNAAEEQFPAMLDADSDDETSPQVVTVGNMAKKVDVSDITFYLVPRLKEHFLIGDLAHSVRRWTPVICEKYGWQLDFLSVRPDYLKWTLIDFPDALIQEMLQILRREISARIFRDFQNLQVGNTANDYWAPGYLVDMQNQEFSTRALMSHIAKNRLGRETPA